MQQLPNDVVQRILPLLNLPSVVALSSTSRDLRRTTKAEYEKRRIQALVKATVDDFLLAQAYARQLERYNGKSIPKHVLNDMPKLQRLQYRETVWRTKKTTIPSFKVGRWHVTDSAMYWTAPVRMFPGMVLSATTGGSLDSALFHKLETDKFTTKDFRNFMRAMKIYYDRKSLTKKNL